MWLHKLAIAEHRRHKHLHFQESGCTGFYVFCSGHMTLKLAGDGHPIRAACLFWPEAAACLATQMMVGRGGSCGVWRWVHDRLTKLLTKLTVITDTCFRLGAFSAILLGLRGSTPPDLPITELMAGLFDASDSVCGCAMKAGAVIGTSASDRAYAAQRSC